MGILSSGLIAGAAGTAALNIVTYADMAFRGRPASRLPSEVAQRLLAKVGATSAATSDERADGAGALLGYASGLTYGLVYASFRRARPEWRPGAADVGVLAGISATGETVATILGLTNPRRWGLEGWMMTAVPRLTYALTAITVFQRIEGSEAR